MTTDEQVKLITSVAAEKGGVYVSERTGMTLAELAAKLPPRLTRGAEARAGVPQRNRQGARRARRLPSGSAIRDALISGAQDAAGCHSTNPTTQTSDSRQRAYPSSRRRSPTSAPPPAELPSGCPAATRCLPNSRASRGDQLLNGIAPLPRMDFVFEGKYAGGDQGIDQIGLVVDEPGERFSLYHWECKFVLPGGQPKLGRTKGGLWIQTGNEWTTQNAMLFAGSTLPAAVVARRPADRGGHRTQRRPTLHPGDAWAAPCHRRTKLHRPRIRRHQADGSHRRRYRTVEQGRQDLQDPATRRPPTFER